MQKSLLFLILFAWAVGVASGAAGRPAAEPPRLNGQWQGPLKVPGGTLTLAITIVPLSNGTYYAALDVPQQRISRMPVEVELKDDNLTLRIEQAGSSFVGKVLAGGDKLSGTWQQPGLKTDLVLERSTAPVAAQAAKKLRLTPPYRESEVTFPNAIAKIKLSGTLTVPSGEGRLRPWCCSPTRGRKTAKPMCRATIYLVYWPITSPGAALPCCASTTGAWGSRAATIAALPRPSL
ncbi:hypothetical protein [Hymenobacter sp. BRD67]|uniref:hypothetical protein n=1 Tax=Hymenobacter sp. BRD67 TaxID=2675877 RepID=UPI0020B8C12C|nr:hypothetical protein [Hymenobacter sp. BRD67]